MNMLTIKLEKLTNWLAGVYKTYFFPKPKRLKLKQWAQLESVRKLTRDHAEHGGWLPVSGLVLETIKLCGVKKNLTNKPWYYTAAVFTEALFVNRPAIDFPILNSKEENGQQIPWDYQGRDWNWWLHMFAKNYGWGEDRVAQMDINTSLALFQEIQTDDQLEKEWQRGLTETAYEYDPATKKSKYKPMKRPDWMILSKDQYKPRPIKTVRMPVAMAPVGNIIEEDESSETSTE